MKNKLLILNLAVLTILLIGAGCGGTNTTQTKPAGNTVQNTTTQNTTEPPVTVTVQTSNGQTTTAKPTPAPTPPPVNNGPKTFTLAEVAIHNSVSSCYTIVNGNVYDVTSFVPNHPGGETNILKICGKDGTNAFDQKHSDQPKPEQMLAKLKIGVLK
ncbi:MAG: hypothetical protein US42_C0006G0030 [Candidatus Magasanikbacteria bacterium GW2011_GWC2_37_14]|uniref:Cytochrome b5 heme-binding domain-containing protein n=1 Tax=Candidatus Magasanikbacteria bacterium GW2011_GWC2_37_14 TaxID=1619046 RepID=A0A0G0G9E9_9BACT|nr:MAG: hypothetical protein US42_C0006G0030 [Candidatus Magasanikbacteria bacterium GW2011_GWC2_37_14]